MILKYYAYKRTHIVEIDLTIHNITVWGDFDYVPDGNHLSIECDGKKLHNNLPFSGVCITVGEK